MAEIFRIFLPAASAAGVTPDRLKDYWRDQVAEAGGVPVKGCGITIRTFGNKVMISGAADRK